MSSATESDRLIPEYVLEDEIGHIQRRLEDRLALRGQVDEDVIWALLVCDGHVLIRAAAYALASKGYDSANEVLEQVNSEAADQAVDWLRNETGELQWEGVDEEEDEDDG